MHHITTQETSPYSQQQLFDLVADIERYPEFLPWCRAARILERRENQLIAELVISFKHITEQYTSCVTLHEPDRIDVTLVKGPFEHLENHWKFIPANQGTTIEIDISFAFKSRLLDRLIGGLFERASQKMVAAFKERADILYGS